MTVTRIEGTNHGWRKVATFTNKRPYQLYSEVFRDGNFQWQYIPRKRFETLAALLKKAYEK